MSPISPPKAVRVKTSTGWVDLAIQGPPGGTGPTGAAGPTGPTGPAGAAGPGVPAGGTVGQALVKKTATDYDTQWSVVAGGGVDYIGNWAAGTAFKKGDVVRYLGNDYMAVNDSTGVVPPAPATPANGVPVPVVNGQWVKGVGGVPVWAAIAAADLPPQAVATYGVALPASPADGAEHVLVDNVANPSYQWRFRYNASSTSAYRWEFVGGAPAIVIVGANEPIGTTGAWAYPATVGPDFVVPRGGDYRIQFSCYSSSPGAAAVIQMGIANASVANNPVGTYAIGYLSAGVYSQMACQTQITGMAAGQTLRAIYQTSASNMTFGFRTIWITPGRVA